MERTILVAEDSPTQADHLRLLLEGEGYRVNVVANGREGLERAQSAPPDLIISDVVMPEMDGFAFCQAVKSAARTKRIPFVLLTERNAPEDFVKGLQHGADNFIAKPAGDYLLERLRRIFENLDLRQKGGLDVEITLNIGGRQIVINADRQQMVELLFSTLEELIRANGSLREAQQTIEEHARDLGAKVRERTEQLLQTEKLATMGELLAGVAHELNNPLAILTGHAHLLRETASDPTVVRRAEKIGDAAERCVRIVRNFLALARQRPPERTPVRLKQVVEGAVELLGYELRSESIEVVVDLATDLPVLSADPHQLHQVLVNLIANAHHAMRRQPQPRRITVSIRHDHERERVRLEVADTGPGISPAIQAKVFDAFFTTKPPGEGTGLGLSLCRGIIEEHGGTITVESETGQGTRFIIELPVLAPLAPTSDAAGAETLAPLGPGVVLVVDDELELAEMIAEALRRDGHETAMAKNGAMALELLHQRPYDVIVTDTKMPVLDGEEFYAELSRRFPALRDRLIFLTGDVLSREKREFLERTGAPFLMKPCDLGELRRVVRRILASTARARVP